MSLDFSSHTIKSETVEEQLKKKQELLTILDRKLLTTVLQPIVDLTVGEIAGYELLVRGPDKSQLHLPEQLFSAAKKYGLVSQLEDICREVTLKALLTEPGRGKVFININPYATVERNLEYVNETLLAELKENLQMALKETDRAWPEADTFCIFECILDFFQQGFEVRLGNKKLETLKERIAPTMYPSFIKIDRFLVHNLRSNKCHMTLLAAMVEYGHSVGAKIVAQGVETEADLMAILHYDVDYAQGYLFAKPAPTVELLPENISQLILSCRQKNRFEQPGLSTLGVSIGDIAEYCPTVCSDILVNRAQRLISEERAQGIVVLNGKRPVGLLTKNKLYYQLGTQYGISLYSQKPVARVMDLYPLIVDAALPLETVSQLAMGRDEDSRYDLIIITKAGQYFGVVSVMHLLNNVTNLQLKYAANANPLTGLPGNLLIEEELKSLVEQKKGFSVLYIDLDNFKAFNDKYGFKQGDKALLLTANILKTSVVEHGKAATFLGHLGGDDFIVITSPEDIEILCRAIITHFEAEITELYAAEDIAKNGITVINRKGNAEYFPIMTISIGVVNSLYQSFENYLEIGARAAEVKQKAKKIPGSAFVTDERRHKKGLPSLPIRIK